MRTQPDRWKPPSSAEVPNPPPTTPSIAGPASARPTSPGVLFLGKAATDVGMPDGADEGSSGGDRSGTPVMPGSPR